MRSTHDMFNVYPYNIHIEVFTLCDMCFSVCGRACVYESKEYLGTLKAIKNKERVTLGGGGRRGKLTEYHQSIENK